MPLTPSLRRELETRAVAHRHQKLHQPSLHRRLREGLCVDAYRATVSDVQSRELDFKLLDF